MTNQFAGFGLRPSLIQTLEELEFRTPTEIQKRVIPAMLSDHSVVGVAETGSGKTLAYALPILHCLKALEDNGFPATKAATPRAAVITPTRELGEQVARVFKRFTHDTRLRVRTIIGSSSLEMTRRAMASPFDILVATPGRLLQFLGRRSVHLEAVRHLVLDEADQLMDLGFLAEAVEIIDGCSPNRQLALFSATIPAKVERLITEVFQEPVIIKTEGSHRMVASAHIRHVQVDGKKRYQKLLEILGEAPEQGTLIFVNTRAQADTLGQRLTEEAGLNATVYHGELDRSERRANLHAFRDGFANPLVATDLGSRGLDLDRVARVINYFLPRSLELYLHRSGRTARMGRSGDVINLVTTRDLGLIRKLEGAKPVRAAAKTSRRPGR